MKKIYLTATSFTFMVMGFSLSNLYFCDFLRADTQVAEFESPRIKSLAGAGRAAPMLTDAVQMNASALGFQNNQGLMAAYEWSNVNPRVPSVSQKIMHASVVDAKNEYAVAGASYTRRPDVDLIQMGIAKKLTENISIGGSAKRYTTRPAYSDIIGKRVGYDGGLSVTARTAGEESPVPIDVGLTLENLVRRESDEQVLGGRRLGLGVRANVQGMLNLYVDYLRNMGNKSAPLNRFAAAVELNTTAGFVARAGISGLKERSWGIGGGWMGPKLGINYGYQKNTDPRDGFEHSISLEIYM